MVNKLLGYILLLVGLVIIFSTLFGSYKVFTGGISVPELFTVPKEGIPSGGKAQDIQAQLEETIRKQIGDMLPADSVPKLLNLIAWSILAGILILGGGKIAGIGVRLISIRNNP
ncbi:hypothetical protein KKE19_03500 [Patescibacteria group bacterium]|nr:hypothetical protein [Patescibacteria group bacterium]MBU4367978.1 hypothetical protein [Patescibacteria group bacterium]MBU4462159.1 hypothetical protein [Patescibacteria group bacterium]MCG2699821.1 hypothetical protein [Candidatus Parcubacteria bacterium]